GLAGAGAVASRSLQPPTRPILPPPIPRPRPIPPPVISRSVRVTSVVVNATVRDGVAETEMTHVFKNDSAAPQEADFLFPIPAGASVSSFAMYDGEKKMEARLLEKDEATRTYEEIVRRRRDPALLTYQGRGALRARVFPIPPNGERKVTLKVVTVLPREGDAKKYAWTLVGPYLPGSARPENVSVRVVVSSAQSVGSIYSPTQEVDIRRTDDKKVVVTWDTSGGRTAGLGENPDFSLYIAPAKNAASSVALSVLSYNASLPQVASLGGGMRGSGYFLVVASPTIVDAAKAALPRRVVFVMDRSGSMQDNNKIEQARGALRFALAKLRPQDRFNVVTFSDRVEKFSPQLIDATPANLKRARSFVDDIVADGGTNIGQALKDGIDQFPEASPNGNTLLFFTDGLPTVGTTNKDTIIREAVSENGKKRARTFVFGVGYDVDVPFLDNVAKSLRGDADYVHPDESIEVKTSQFVAKTSAPVLENLKLTISGGNAGEVYPKPGELPDLFAGGQLVVVGRYTDGNAPAKITLSGVAGGKPQTYTTETRFPAVATEASFLPRLWASRKIGYLMDDLRLRDNEPVKKEIVDQIISLSREFGVLTPYTALFVPEPGSDQPVPMDAISRVNSAGNLGGGFGGGGFRDQDGYIAGRAAPTSGAAAVDLSQSARGQRTQNQVGNVYAYRAKSSEAMRKDEQSAQRIQNVASRTFYQVGPVWTDANFDKAKQKEIVRVKLYSDAYFALTRRNADLAKWAALGDQVLIAANAKQALQFGLEGKESLTESEVIALAGK
ncbi:MAG: VIT and VWA domain-containing protein, partial [Armatimonadota bacterium]